MNKIKNGQKNRVACSVLENKKKGMNFRIAKKMLEEKPLNVKGLDVILVFMAWI